MYPNGAAVGALTDDVDGLLLPPRSPEAPARLPLLAPPAKPPEPLPPLLLGPPDRPWSPLPLPLPDALAADTTTPVKSDKKVMMVMKIAWLHDAATCWICVDMWWIGFLCVQSTAAPAREGVCEHTWQQGK